MTKQYKFLYFFFIVSMVGTSLPSFLHAQSDADSFCEQVVSISETAEAKVVEKKKAFELKQAEHFNRMANNRLANDKKWLEKKDTWDIESAQKFATLEGKAKSAEEKQAVEEFKTSVTGALEIRRRAVEKAIADFRSDIDEEIEARTEALDMGIKEFQTAVELATTNAEGSCANSVESAAVRKEFKDQVNAGIRTLKKASNDFEGSSTFKSLLDTRNQSVEIAQIAFKDSLAQALTDLKTSFPKAVK
jgi:hypothetical protein